MLNMEPLVPGKLIEGEIKQLGYIVPNIDDGMVAWTEQMGLGPWVCYKNVKLTGTYRGEPTETLMNVALAYQGNLQIELIEPVGEFPSPYQEFIDRGQWGLHHYAYICDDMDAAVKRCEENKLTLVFDITDGINRYLYVESELMPGVFIELIEASDYFLESFAQGVELSKDWNGDNPISTIDLAG